MRTSPTIELTIFPNAAPMITPTARSTTFPLRANSLNSERSPMPAPSPAGRRGVSRPRGPAHPAGGSGFRPRAERPNSHGRCRPGPPAPASLGAGRLAGGAAGPIVRVPILRTPPDPGAARARPWACSATFAGRSRPLGNQKTYRGKAKYLGGVGKKITGTSRRTYYPNLQSIRWSRKGRPSGPACASSASGPGRSSGR